MYPIDSPGSVAGSFVNTDPVGGTPGTQVDAAWMNEAQAELLNMLSAAGIAPVKGTRTQVRDALRRLFGGFVTTLTNPGSPYTLSAANAGLVIVDASGGPVVINLPAANLLPTGLLRYLIVRIDPSSNVVTVNPAGADTFADGSVSISLLYAFQALELLADAVSKWYLRLTQDDSLPNEVLNGGLDWWQEIEANPTDIANGSTQYGPDQFWGKCSLGTSGVLTLSQVGAFAPGLNRYTCKLVVKTAPTAAQANGCEFYYGWSGLDTLRLINQVLSLGASVIAFGNVSQAGIQFCYKTTRGKPDTFIGAEVTFAVNAATPSLGRIIGQALGSAMTTGGIIGFRIRPTGVSSGNLWDVGNGIGVEWFKAVRGRALVSSFTRRDMPQMELLALQRMYFKTFRSGVVPASGGGDQAGALLFANLVGSGVGRPLPQVRFPIEMEVIPTVTPMNPTAANSQVHDNNAAANWSATVVYAVDGKSVTLAGNSPAGGAVNDASVIHLVADARY